MTDELRKLGGILNEMEAFANLNGRQKILLQDAKATIAAIRNSSIQSESKSKGSTTVDRLKSAKMVIDRAIKDRYMPPDLYALNLVGNVLADAAVDLAEMQKVADGSRD